MRWWTLVFSGMLCLCAYAEEPAAPAPAPETAETVSAGEGPVVLPPPTDEAVRFYKTGIVVWLVNLAWGIVLPGIVLFTGFSARIRNVAQGLGKKWPIVVAIYAILFSLATYLIDLPWSFYTDYVRMHDFGLSNQTFGKWAYDSVMGLLVGTIVTALILWVPYLLLRKAPKRWWLYTGLLMYPFFIFQMLISPVWIDPLFNEFGEMQDKNLEAKVLEIASRAGIEGSRVFEVDKSVDTKAYNAYVTGIFNTKRIVLWDTIIEGLEERSLLFVMAHEMAHFVLGHVYNGIMLFGTLTLLGFYFVHKTSGWIMKRYGERMGFDQLSDVASYPLIMMLMAIAIILLQPAALALIRYQEHESDRFALELTRDNYAGAAAFAKMNQDNLGYPYPHPILKILRSSHPPLGERVTFCNEYKPWEEGKPLKYGHLFASDSNANTNGGEQ
ncbi:MAG TPA: M48 family metallopeptidase [Candidatus Hydrogenedentes bacterium]|nr:M48 family metallopeptidase [Candidatus Hydrogenedentota bacterium]